MAKKKYKQSAYTRARNNVLRLQRDIQKHGGHVDGRHLFTENEQKLRGLKGKELTKATNQMKKLEAELKKQRSDQRKIITEPIDIADEVRDIYETNRIYEELEEVAPYETALESQLDDMYLPDGGEIMVDNVAEDIQQTDSNQSYESVYYEFDEKAHQPIDPINQYGRKKKEDVYRNAIRAQYTVWKLLMDSVATEGKSATGYKIQNSGANADENLEIIIYRASKDDDIEQALTNLENILADHVLTAQERQDIDDEIAYNDVYEDYGLQ